MAETAARLQFLTRNGERTMPQAALRFVLDDPRVTSVIVGAKTPAQIEENISAASVPAVDETEREQIQKVFDV